MLRELHISGLGVIDDLDLELHPGLNVLTGETGTGKTMVTVGLQLALGRRGGASLVRAGAPAAKVQARFDAPPSAANAGWAEDGEVLLARTVTAEGRSTARVSGQLAPVSALAELAGELVEVHGQHDGQRLLSTVAQTRFLDRYAGARAPRRRRGPPRRARAPPRRECPPRRARRARTRPRTPDGSARLPGARDRGRVAAAGRDRGAEARGGQARPRRPPARAGLVGRACARGRGRRGRCPRDRVGRAPDGRRGRPRGRGARGAGVRAERLGHRARGGGSHLPRAARARPRAAAGGPRTDRRARRAPAQVREGRGGGARLPRPGTGEPRRAGRRRAGAGARRGRGRRTDRARRRARHGGLGRSRHRGARADAGAPGGARRARDAGRLDRGHPGPEPGARLRRGRARGLRVLGRAGAARATAREGRVGRGALAHDARVQERARRPGRRADADLRRGGRGDRRAGRGRRRAAPGEPRARRGRSSW